MKLRTLFSLLAALTLSTAAHTQTVYMSETFDNVIPPTGWTHHDLNGAGSVGWIPGVNSAWMGNHVGWAWHEDEYGVTAENRLESPVFSLSGATQAYLHFGAETNYSNYLANHPNSIGNGISDIQISSDGGLTWTTIWTDTSDVDGTYEPNLSLSTYLGSPSVQVGIYFFGDFAQEWWVDFVQVDDTPVPVLGSVTNPSNGHPYFLLGECDWQTAQTMALTLGGTLASISDSLENEWIRTQANGHDVWIGINDVQTEGAFEWVNGEAVTYTNWASGQGVNTPLEDFGLLSASNGSWSDEEASRTARAIVEISHPILAYEDLVAGQLVTFSCGGLPTGSRVIFIFSTNGPGPYNSPYGVLEVFPDILTPLFYTNNGRFEFSTVLPLGMSGATLYGQALAFMADSSTDLSNAVAEPVL